MRTRSSIDLLRIGTRTQVLAAALALLPGLGCRSENPVEATGPNPAATTGPSQAPTDWTVTLGSSGGFTGGASGYRVEANGQVTAWSKATAKADVTSNPVGTASESSLADLHSAMTSEDLLATDQSASGNTVSFLEWKQGQETRRYTWVETDTPSGPVARAFQAALAAVEDARSGVSR